MLCLCISIRGCTPNVLLLISRPVGGEVVRGTPRDPNGSFAIFKEYQRISKQIQFKMFLGYHCWWLMMVRTFHKLPSSYTYTGLPLKLWKKGTVLFIFIIWVYWVIQKWAISLIFILWSILIEDQVWSLIDGSNIYQINRAMLLGSYTFHHDLPQTK